MSKIQSLTKIMPHYGADINANIPSFSTEDREELVALLAEYKILRFRNQKLTPNQAVAFGDIFAPCLAADGEDKILFRNGDAEKTHPDNNKIVLISNSKRKEREGVLKNLESKWHNDLSHKPWDTEKGTLMARILYAESIPSIDVPTIYIDQEWLYDHCPIDLRNDLETRHAVYKSTMKGDKPFLRDWGKVCERKIVLENPITGKKAITIENNFLDHIIGYDNEKFLAIQQQLLDIAKQPENLLIHNWQVGDLVLMNNYNTAHTRPHFSSEEERILWRITFQIPELIPKKFI